MDFFSLLFNNTRFGLAFTDDSNLGQHDLPLSVYGEIFGRFRFLNMSEQHKKRAISAENFTQLIF